MRVLISAYACEPNKGSEPEVGWRWMIDASKKYDEVVVVTRANNQINIEKVFYKLDIKNVKFEYFDLPKWASFWKKGGRGVQLYTYLWELFLFPFLLKRYQKEEFDLAQRVTFVTYRFPSFIWYFSKKFTLGPIAGGERFPLNFLKIFTFKGKIKESLRMIIQRVSLFDPFVLLSLYKSDKIIAVTQDTKTILPKFAQKKVTLQPAISIDKNDFNIDISKRKIRQKEDKLKLLYVGNLLEFKGILLTLKALKDIDSNGYEFNIVGSGKDKKIFDKYIVKYHLNVNFLGQKNRRDLSQYYLSSDILVFPSLHDSGGMVVLEAKAHGMRVIVSSFGGPKIFVDENDIIINEDNLENFVNKLAWNIDENITNT